MNLHASSFLAAAALLARAGDAFAPHVAPRPRAALPARSTAAGGFVLFMGWGDDVEFKTATVVSNAAAAEGIRSITVEAGDDILGPYAVPGQFVQIKETPEGKAGFYAIASAPGASAGSCELLIKESAGNDWSPGNAWLCGAEAGAELIMSPAMGGGFKVAEKLAGDDVTDVLLFAAGSGISPIRAVIESGALEGKDVTLYYGARGTDAMSYQDKFDAWEAAGVKVVPVLSQGGDDWTGRKGYVQAALAEDGVAAAGATGALLCGMKGMAEDVTAALTAAGVEEGRVLTNF